MPSSRRRSACLPCWALIVATCLAFAATAGCQKKAGDVPPPTAAPLAGTSTAAPPTPSDAPPPEQYAKLPPGAFPETPADTAAASQPAASPPAGKAPDPGLVPNAGNFDLTGARLGMSTVEVYERYPADSGWGYDKQFTPDSETGVVLAKPNDPRARATEMFMLLDGTTVAFLRVVEEDSAAFIDTVGSLGRFGTPTSAPPDWARKYKVFRGWHETPNEQSRFWSNQARLQVLTAGHAPGDNETVYMLLDLPRMEQVEEALKSAGKTPPPDFGWSHPGAGQAPPAAPGA